MKFLVKHKILFLLSIYVSTLFLPFFRFPDKVTFQPVYRSGFAYLLAEWEPAVALAISLLIVVLTRPIKKEVRLFVFLLLVSTALLFYLSVQLTDLSSVGVGVISYFQFYGIGYYPSFIVLILLLVSLVYEKER